MAKISETDRHMYHERVKDYVSMTKAMTKNENEFLMEIRKKPDEASLRKLTLSDHMLNLASNYMAINGVSQAVLKVKNEEALNDARKVLYKAIIYLEDIVTNYIDSPYSDYEEKLAAIATFDQNQRYLLIRKLGFAIDLIEHAYGDNSKWRWTFVEMEGRFATTAKNILDLRNVIKNSEPDSPYYDATTYHIRLVKKLLSQSADRYREKYELSTSQMSDFKTGIAYLGALRRLHMILSESEEAEELKKKHAIWSAKLDKDMKKQEEAKKRAG